MDVWQGAHRHGGHPDVRLRSAPIQRLDYESSPMTTPIVTERTVALEPTTRDNFLGSQATVRSDWDRSRTYKYIRELPRERAR